MPKKKKTKEEKRRKELRERAQAAMADAPTGAEPQAEKPVPAGSSPAGKAVSAIERRRVKKEQNAGVTMERIVIATLLGVAVITGAYFLIVFESGEELQWKQDLAEADRLFEEEKYSEAAAALTQFGEDWPGARETLDWNRKMGLYHAQAGAWEQAAQYFDAALEISPNEPGLNARAGEAYWKAGEKETAWDRLGTEIEDVNAAIGDHDRARYYLGVSMMEEGRYQQAFNYFEAISDREEWEQQLAVKRAELEELILKPARQEAEQKAEAALQK